jgi:hypothetical protein
MKESQTKALLHFLFVQNAENKLLRITTLTKRYVRQLIVADRPKEAGVHRADNEQ